MNNRYKASVLACVTLLSSGCGHKITLRHPLAPPVTLACSASPESVFPGDPVTVTAAAGDLNPKDHVTYSWSGAGVTGGGTRVKIDTSNLAPGAYTVTGTVKQDDSGQEGMKPWDTATCTASLTVKAFEPPTISCSVNPATVAPGGTATVTSVGVSPQNLSLIYGYSATAGTVTGKGTTAEYSSAGAPTGAVGITCNVSDKRGHSATSNTSLTIVASLIPVPPEALALCSISFSTDKKHPTTVDNESKACLKAVAQNLRQQQDARVELVGEETAAERAKGENFAAQRAVNAKDYLVTRQGIDRSRISVATGSTPGETVETYLVPSGASFTSEVKGTTPVDETLVKPQENPEQIPNRSPAFVNESGTTQNLVAQPTCNSFAVLGYPSINLDDLDSTDNVRQSLRLAIGNFDPKYGINKSDVDWQLCQAAGYKGNNGSCISQSDWDKITNGCQSPQPLSGSFKTYDHKTDYFYKVWEFPSALPASVCASLVPQGTWIQISLAGSADLCRPSSDGSASWAWTAVIKDTKDPQSGDTSVQFGLTNQASSAALVQGKLGSLELAPHHGPWNERALNWLENSTGAHLDGWIFGGSSTGILVILIGFLRNNPRFPWSKSIAKTPELPQPRQPINIFIAPSKQDPHLEEPPAHRGGPRRPRHRSSDPD